MGTSRELAELQCALDGHAWAVVRYRDGASVRTGEVWLALWAFLRCWRCGATTCLRTPVAAPVPRRRAGPG